MTQPIPQAKYVNVVVITGKVLQTPDLRYTAVGRAGTTIRVACHFSYANDAGRRVHDSEYHYVKAGGGTGNQLYEVGRGRHRGLHRSPPRIMTVLVHGWW